MNWIDFDLHRTHVLENMSKHLNLKLKTERFSGVCDLLFLEPPYNQSSSMDSHRRIVSRCCSVVACPALYMKSSVRRWTGFAFPSLALWIRDGQHHKNKIVLGTHSHRHRLYHRPKTRAYHSRRRHRAPIGMTDDRAETVAVGLSASISICRMIY